MNPLRSNVHAYDKISRLKNLIFNERYEKEASRLYQVDSISDIGAFREGLKCMEGRLGGRLDPYYLGGESLFYGHLKCLMEHAGLTYTTGARLVIPALSHGVFWTDDPRLITAYSYSYVHTVVAQGRYRKDVRHPARTSLPPQYAVGPYVRYAQGIYPAERFRRLKSELGSVALVYPAHTHEGSSADWSIESYVDSVMGRYAGRYDSVLVSAYWNDVSHPLFDAFERAGARVVCNGLRSDCNFIRRLRTLIELADVVAGNGLGTNIGYALALGKPFEFFGDEDSVYSFCELPNVDLDADRYVVTKAFAPGNVTESDLSTQAKLYRKYWGGEQELKSARETRGIFEVSQAILDESGGWVGRFDSVTRSLLDSYRRSSDPDDALRGRLLADALGES